MVIDTIIDISKKPSIRISSTPLRGHKDQLTIKNSIHPQPRQFMKKVYTPIQAH